MQVPLTIRDFLDHAALVYPDRAGFVDEPDQPADSWGSVTYAEMAKRAKARPRRSTASACHRAPGWPWSRTTRPACSPPFLG